MKIYSIYDIVSGEYGNPFCAINHEDCKRKLSYHQQGNPFAKDLKVFLVGEFNVDSGVIMPISCPEFMFNVADLLNNGDLE